MAHLTDHPPEVARLLAQAQAARARLGRGVAQARQRLDVPAKIVRSLREHPLRWVGGVAATGLAATLLLRALPGPRARKPKRCGGVLFSLALAAAKPALKAWLAHQAKTRLEALIADRLHYPPR
jgi:hypothetical protein